MNFKSYFLSALVAFSSFAAVAQTPVWTQLPGSPSGTARNDDIYFTDATNGWTARGTSGIHKTTDGGKTWTQVLTKPGTHFRSIGFLTPTHGFAGNLGVGSYDNNVSDTNVLYETTNGGLNWQVFPGLSEAGMKGFCALYVLDSQHIYGGGRVRGPAHFVKSEDGGTNWTVQNLTTAGVMGGIMDVYFKDPTNGFVVGMDTNAYNTCAAPFYHGAIARTTNGGTTWEAVANSGVNCSYFWKMSWPSPQVGYASLQQNGASSSLIFFKTTDGGASWSSNSIPYSAIGVSTFFLQGIGFISANEGWVGGASSTTPYQNNFLHTTDGGATWEKIGYNDSRSINRIRFYPKFAVASGAKLHIYRVPLLINAQPLSQTNAIGSTVTLIVEAQGTAPLEYQWRFNSVNISNAITNSYSIANFQTTNAGNYDVVISDYSGSVTSSVAALSFNGATAPPVVTTQPQSQTVLQGSNVTFSVTASGNAPLVYQWNFEESIIPGATNDFLSLSNVQPANSGNYFATVTNAGGSVNSSNAVLTVLSTPNILFSRDFDNFVSPLLVTNVGTTNGYKIVFRSTSSVVDFKAIFGFDYSTVTYPTTIPSAPHSLNGTTKGLLLTVNKDAISAAAAVNLYPTNQFFSGDFALKFDMWINWANINTSTEHTLFGINHSGNITNRVGQSPSDGLFFAVEGEADSSTTSTSLRNYSVFRGGGTSAPVLLITNNFAFGPTPLLGARFDNTDAGFQNLFPAQTFAGYGSVPAGIAGLRWISGEVRQENNLITWLMNGVAIAQYTNTFAYTNGNILLGYNDYYDSTGDSNNFVVFDNIRVERTVLSPVTLLSPKIQSDSFSFKFASELYETYTVQRATDLTSADWTTYTNVVGDGAMKTMLLPISPEASQQYYRVVRP